MTNKMAKVALIVGLLCMTSLLTNCTSADSSSEEMTPEQLIERGKYLVTVGDCEICHTPKRMTSQGPVPDGSLSFSGHPANLAIPEIPEGFPDLQGWAGMANAHMTAWAGPWGISLASNLTPHEDFGMGAWDEEDFIKAMRTGQHMGMGRQILPPMPWQALSHMTDDDLKAMFAYLHSIPAIPNQVPGPIPPAGSGETP
jgi:mono/diheme cytochrome c family protein